MGPTQNERIERLEQSREEIGDRLTEVERHAVRSRVRDATHSTKIDSLEKAVERGFSVVSLELARLRKHQIRLTFIVGGLYAVLRWGAPVAEKVASAVAPILPVPPAAAEVVAPAPSPSPGPLGNRTR